MAGLAQKPIKQMRFRDEAKRELAVSALGLLLHILWLWLLLSRDCSVFCCPVIIEGIHRYDDTLQEVCLEVHLVHRESSRLHQTTAEHCGTSGLRLEGYVPCSDPSLVRIQDSCRSTGVRLEPIAGLIGAYRRLNDPFVCGDL